MIVQMHAGCHVAGTQRAHEPGQQVEAAKRLRGGSGSSRTRVLASSRCMQGATSKLVQKGSMSGLTR
jgi:hypothetical protein